MGQCISSLQQAGEPPEEYKRRWTSGPGVSDGVDGGYRAASTYTTTANVGMGTGKDRFVFLQHQAGRHALDPIDEQASLNANTSPARQHGGWDESKKDLAKSSNSALRPRASCGGPPGADSRQTGPLNWTKGELIGQGAFGSVFLGMDNDTGQLMAVKQVHVSKAGSSKVSEHVTALEAEVRLLQQLDHPNIVRYLSTETTNDALHIFLEFVPGGSIASLLAKFGHFRETVVKVYTRQILLGLEYLHAHGIIHRDIKGANILVDNTGLVKLADFGASKKIEDLVTIDSGFKSMKGTPYWMAPEIIKQSGHGRQADIWSVACTVIEMATGRPPWSGLGSQVAAMFHIASSKGPPPIPEHLSAECKDFLYLCFNRNWKDRPLAAQLLQHPFLASVPPRTVAAPLASIATGRAAGVGGAPAIPPVAARAAPPATQAGEHAAGGEGAQGDLDSPAIKAWRTPPKAGGSPSGSSDAGRVGDGDASDPDTPPGPSGDPSPAKGSEGPARTASQGRGVAAGPGSACGAFGGGAAEGAGVDAGTIPGPVVVAARGAVAAGKAAHAGSPLPCRPGPGLSQRGAGEGPPPALATEDVGAKVGVPRQASRRQVRASLPSPVAGQRGGGGGGAPGPLQRAHRAREGVGAATAAPAAPLTVGPPGGPSIASQTRDADGARGGDRAEATPHRRQLSAATSLRLPGPPPATELGACAEGTPGPDPGIAVPAEGGRGGDGGQSCVDATGTSGEGGVEAGAPVRSDSTCPGRRERPAATSIRAAPSAGVRQSMPALRREREASRSPTERSLSGSAAFLPGRAGSEAGRHLHGRPSGEGTAAGQQADLAPGAEAPGGDSGASSPLHDTSRTSSPGRAGEEEAEAWVLHSVPPSPALVRRWQAPARPQEGMPAGGASAPGSSDQSLDPGSNQSTYNPMEEPSWMPGGAAAAALAARLAAAPSEAATSEAAPSEAPRERRGAPVAAPVEQARHARAPSRIPTPPSSPWGAARAARSTVARPATERAGVTAMESLPPPSARRRHSDASPRDPIPPPAADSWEEAAAVATAAGPDAREDKDLGSWWPPPPARDHMVWTNEDGDIDALPWDVGRSSMAAPAGLFRAALG
ncbi:hypothetical protein ACKKBF_B01735 [Auxenochlorella protothecoides x Auxenochlorella symbiontica]